VIFLFLTCEFFDYEHYQLKATNLIRANDVALLMLKEPAVMGPTVMLPCLPELGDYGDASSFHPGRLKHTVNIGHDL
jgi:hypothetical protein